MSPCNWLAEICRYEQKARLKIVENIRGYIRPFFLVILLAFIWIASYTQLNRVYPWVYHIGLAASGISFFAAIFARRISLSLLGIGICVLPFLGGGHLNLFVASWLLGTKLKSSRWRTNENLHEVPLTLSFSLILLIVPFGLGAVSSFLRLADPYILETVILGGGWREFNRYLAKGHFIWHHAILIFVGYLIMAMLARELCKSKSNLRYLRYGLAIGVLISSAVCVAQWYEWYPILSFNRDAFWVFTNRYEGTFSDPNALGLATAILLPIFIFFLWKERDYLSGMAGLSLVLVAPSSGSRSAILGLCIVYVLFSIRRSATRFRTLALGALVFLGCAYILSIPSVNTFLQERSPAVAITRMLKTLNQNTAGDSLSSRSIMGEIALQMWQEHSVIGVGLNRFYGLQDNVAERYDIPLGTWRDNANNYYLQILSELGLCGFLLLVLSIYMLWESTREERDTQDSSRSLYKLLLLAFGIILFTGPHLFFDELRYLLALLIAGSLRFDSPKFTTRIRWGLAGIILLVSTVYLSVLSGQIPEKNMQGFWGREGNTVWTGKRARFYICPDPLNPTKLRVRTYNPDLPLSFTLSYREGKPMKLHLIDKEWSEIPIEMPFPGSVELNINKLWSPPQDRRWLGILMEIPNSLCGEELAAR